MTTAHFAPRAQSPRRRFAAPWSGLWWSAYLAAGLIGCADGASPGTAAKGLDVAVDVGFDDLAGVDMLDDIGILDASQPDVAALDLGGDPADAVPADTADSQSAGDVADAAGACSSAGCPCLANSDCDAGYCIETAAGQVCAQPCVTTCPAGQNCKTVATSGGDTASFCVPSHPRICEPCKADSDCTGAVGGANSTCVPYVTAGGALVGQFCGSACDDANPCPSGYGCETVTSVGGQTSKQCRKVDLQCACDGRAIKLGLATPCSSANAAGKCAGTRACSIEGLSACNAPAAASETCNDADDDCDGKTDEAEPGVCDDGTACTYDNCIGGKCQHPPATGACDDANVCTEGDKCSDGDCVGAAVSCDDGSACTTDACAAGKGCTHTPVDSACDDGNPCTTDTCNTVGGCANQNNTGPCDDGDVCTLQDACSGGACGHQAKLPCNDGNPCTDDTCDPLKGCVFTANTATCSDNNVCTTGDLCSGGACNATGAQDCDDSNPCTYDTCFAKDGCKHAPTDAACSDGNPCTVGDACSGGKCAPGKGIECDDGNPCTTDVCDAAKGCVTFANAAACDDDNVCTLVDQCQNGKCTGGKAKICNDGSPCTDDACDPTTGCTATPNSAACSDGDACTQNDQCAGGLCAGGALAVCNDGNPCTDDSCDKVAGCQVKFNTSTCSDGNFCTVGDACKNGTCAPAGMANCDDGDVCTSDGCDYQTGCTTVFNSSPCNDNSVCTVGDTCAGGQCAPGKLLSCDDGNTCTNDACDPQDGCTHVANGAPCSDGNPCTIGDGCAGGLCAAVGLLNCDDGNACTDDVCIAPKGCTSIANTAACSDGSVCTSNDVCSGGACKAGAPTVCDDGNPCTDDSCDVQIGCQFKTNTASCDDKNGCTTGDTCNSGSCAGTYGCSGNAQCTSVGGALTCVCNAGYSGNGLTCATVCGDGVVAGTEACDDKNAIVGDGCSLTCALEAGYTCTGAPSVCKTTCGDGVKAGSEQCDSGAGNANTADKCRTTCQLPACGDGIKDAGEGCDDGNLVPGDGCNATCASEQIKCKNGTTLSQAPSGKAVLCQNPGSCEQDKGNDCPAGFHLCTLGEFNTYNTNWSYTPSNTVVGAIGCRGGGGAGHLTIYGNLQNDVSNNCDWGSSNPWCTSGYGCNEQQGLGVCCVDNASCGNGVLEAPLEACDDGNKVNGDGCDNNCMKSNPGC